MQSIITYQNLLEQIKDNLHDRKKDTTLETYWQVGRYIIMDEQKGSKKAKYGSQKMQKLAEKLTVLFGKNFSRSNMIYMRLFYFHFSISETKTKNLTWSHYFEILKAKSELEIKFYTQQAQLGNWNVRQLKQNMKNKLFYHTNLSDIIQIQ